MNSQVEESLGLRQGMSMWAYLSLVVLASSLADAGAAVVSGKIDVDTNSIGSTNNARKASTSSGLLSDFRHVYNVYEECKDENFATCLKMKLVTSLDTVVRSVRTISLFEGVALVRDEDDASAQETAGVSEQQLRSTLPRALDEREHTLDSIILDKLVQMFRTHSLRFKLLDGSDARGSDVEVEGARKRKGINSLLLVAMLMAGTMIPLKFGALALLAGKALIISKLALALALIIALKKLVSSGGGHETSYQVVTVPHGHGHGGGGSHYKRSIHEISEANDLAYSYYDPKLTLPLSST